MDVLKEIVAEWIDVAREDSNAALKLAEVPYVIPACFHCQQSVEKILKAYIIANGNKLTKTHDLDDLICACEKHNSDFVKYKDACTELTQFVITRYPPERKQRDVSLLEMEKALKTTKDILEFTLWQLKELGFEVETNKGSVPKIV